MASCVKGADLKKLNMSPKIKILSLALGLMIAVVGCDNADLNPSGKNVSVSTLDLAQLSGQLASGSSFAFKGSSTSSTYVPGGRTMEGRESGNHHDRHHGILDGVNLLAPTNELLAIVEAESAGDIRGMRIGKLAGAAVTHFDAAGDTVSFPIFNEAPHDGCSFSGFEAPGLDRLLNQIVRTEIDFGDGLTITRDTVSITRKGKIVIERTLTDSTKTEVVTFENYSVNDNKIEGTKTRVSKLNLLTGYGESNTVVTDGKITFSDGSVATWTSEKQRVTQIDIALADEDEFHRSGTITTTVNSAVTLEGGAVIYAHKTNEPLVRNMECARARRKGPVSGELETVYRDTTVVVTYGDGTCENRTVTITVNGVQVTPEVE